MINFIDISDEQIEDIHVKGGDGFVVLVIGDLQIKMTEEQEEQLRWYYENT